MNPLRPVWTPEDAAQTAIDAAKHVGVSGIPDDSDFLAARRDAVGRAIAELEQPIYNDPILGFTPAPTSPPRGRHRPPEPAGMRPRRALRVSRAVLAVAVIVLVLTVGALWLVHA